MHKYNRFSEIRLLWVTWKAAGDVDRFECGIRPSAYPLGLPVLSGPKFLRMGLRYWEASSSFLFLMCSNTRSCSSLVRLCTFFLRISLIFMAA